MNTKYTRSRVRITRPIKDDQYKRLAWREVWLFHNTNLNLITGDPKPQKVKLSKLMWWVDEVIESHEALAPCMGDTVVARGAA